MRPANDFQCFECALPRGEPQKAWKEVGRYLLEIWKYVDLRETIVHQIIQCTILAHTLSTRLDYVMTNIKKMK